MQPGEFLKLLWSSAGDRDLGCATIWLKQDKESLHLPLADVFAWEDGEDDQKFLDEIVGARDAYTSPGLRCPGLEPHRQGARRDVVAVSGFVLDIDLATDVGEAHKAKNLPPEEAVRDILEIGTDPTIVVRTGYGLHAWWLFDELLLTPSAQMQKRADLAFEEFQLRYIERVQELGYHCDKTATIQRVFRLPGTKNYKRESAPRDVEVIYGEGPRYAIDDLVPRWKLIGNTRVVNRLLPEGPLVERAERERVEPTVPAKDGSLEAAVQSLRQISPDHEHYGRVQALLKGKSFAMRGERNRTMYALAWLVANRGRTLSAEQLAEIFRPSLSVWAAEPDAQKDVEDEIHVVTQQIASALERIREEDSKKAAELAMVYRGLLRSGDKKIEDEVEGVTPEDVMHAAIVQNGTHYWVFDFGMQDRFPMPAGYYGPFVEKALWLRCEDSWNGGPDDYQLTYIEEKNKKVDGETITVEIEKNKSTVRIIQEYGSYALQVVSELATQKTWYDIADRTLHEALCPIRDLEPRYDEQIQEWLLLLGGEKLIDWASAVTKLEHPCCALYIEGPPNAGKNLFANGLARLFRSTGPSSFASMMNGYNYQALGPGGCPIIHLDEGLPKSATATSAFIRNLVGAVEHSASEKYMPTRKVLGAIRLLITANNDSILAAIANEDMSDNDLEATVDRFLHVRASDESSAWIRARNGDKKLTASWVEGDLMARHVLWLRDNWKLTRPGKRFLIDGEPAEVHRAIVTRGDRRGIVLEWLARFMTNPTKVMNHYSTKREAPLAHVGNGELLVNTQALIDCADAYRKLLDRERMSSSAIGRVLGQLSEAKIRPRINGDDTRMRFHKIRVDYVLSWADGDAQVGDLKTMLENLNRVIEEAEHVH